MRYYNYNGDELLKYCHTAEGKTGEQNESLKGLRKLLDLAYNDDKWQGKTAERFKSYHQDIYGTTLAMFGTAVSALYQKCADYTGEYLRKVDSADHAVINTSDLEDLAEFAMYKRDWAARINTAVQGQVSNVRDIVYIRYVEPGVKKTLESIRALASDTKSAVEKEEKNFTGNGFDEIDKTIAAIKEMLAAGEDVKVSSDGRTLNYDPAKYQAAFQKSYEAYTAQQDYNKAHLEEAKLNDAANKAALERRQKELEERQRAAFGLKIVVGIIGAAVTIATAGAAGPVVAIAAGAAVGAISAGVDSYTSQMVGDIYGAGDVKWDKVFGDAAVGAITGAVTGAIGAGSAGLVAKAGKIASPVLRVGANVAIKTGEKVVSGVSTRFINGVAEGDLSKVLDWDEIKGDLASGAIGGAMGELADGINGTRFGEFFEKNKVLEYGRDIIEDQIGDGVERFGETLAKTGDVDAAWEQATDKEEAAKSLVSTVTKKATGDYVSKKRAETHNKDRSELNAFEKMERDYEKDRIRDKAYDKEFRAQQDAQTDRKVKKELGRQYNDGAKAREKAGKPEYKLTKEQYVNKYENREAAKDKTTHAYFEKARKSDGKAVASSYKGMMNNANKGILKQGIKTFGGNEFEAPEQDNSLVTNESVSNMESLAKGQ